MNKTTTSNRTLHMSHIAGAALLLGACSSDDASTTANQEDYEQIAQSLAGNASVWAEPVTFSVISDLAIGLLPDGLSLDTSGRFSGNHGGMTYDGTLTCVDLGPQLPAPCGPATSMAKVTGTWTGQLQLPRLTISLTRTGTWTLSGLQTATVTVDGTSHTDLTSLFASASDQNHKQLVLASDAIYQAISVDRVSHLPVGGDIQYAVTGERTHTTPGLDATQPFSADATLTFGADHTATLVIDGDQQFAVDLETGEARPERD